MTTMASVYAYASTPLMASYAASKAAVLNPTKTAALELRDAGGPSAPVSSIRTPWPISGDDFERLAGLPGFGLRAS